MLEVYVITMSAMTEFDPLSAHLSVLYMKNGDFHMTHIFDLLSPVYIQDHANTSTCTFICCVDLPFWRTGPHDAKLASWHPEAGLSGAHFGPLLP